MKRWKKHISLMLCVLLALGCFTPIALAEEMVTISLYRPNFLGVDENAVAAVQNEINAYIGDKIGVQVEIHELADLDYPEKLNLELAAGGDVDVFFTAKWFDIIGTDQIVKNNAAYDLSELLQNYPELYNSMSEVFWQGSRYNGRDYFIPIYKDIVSGYSVFAHPETAEAIGCDMAAIQQLSDLTPYLAKADELGLRFPFLWQNEKLFDYFSIDQYYSIEPFAGVPTTGDTNKIVNMVATDAYMDYCKLMNEWADAGYINEAEATKSVPADAYVGDEFGFTWITSSVDGSYAAILGWEPVTAQLTKGWVTTGATLGACYGINVKSEKVDASLKFLQLLMTDKTLADLYTYGVEGVNYTRDDSGKVLIAEDNTYHHWAWESASLKTVSLTVDQADDYIAALEAFNEKGTAVPCMGFHFDSTPVSAEYAAVNNVVEQYAYLLETGFIEPEEGIPQYLSALSEAGVDVVIAEMQAQYDAWLAAE